MCCIDRLNPQLLAVGQVRKPNDCCFPNRSLDLIFVAGPLYSPKLSPELTQAECELWRAQKWCYRPITVIQASCPNARLTAAAARDGHRRTHADTTKQMLGFSTDADPSEVLKAPLPWAQKPQVAPRDPLLSRRLDLQYRPAEDTRQQDSLSNQVSLQLNVMTRPCSIAGSVNQGERYGVQDSNCRLAAAIICKARLMSAASTLVVKHAAAGPYLGFALQQVRLCYYLLSSPSDASVSLEYLDDVAVHHADGTLLLEQCKSALAHNPTSDWSNDLWKTIANWLDIVETQRVDGAKASFQLYVTPPKPGKLSAAMHTAADAKAVDALVKQVKDKLKKRANPPECIAHVQKFLDTTDALRLTVVGKTSVIATDADPLEPIRERLRSTVPEESLDVICASAIGQAKEAADKCIRRKAPALVGVAEFRRNFHAFIRQNNMAGYLPTFTSTPSKDTAKALLASRPVFVRQLKLIEASEEQQLRAASDLLRTSGEKVKWADQGLVFGGTFEDWEDTLLRKHDSTQSEVKDTYSAKSQDAQGRIVYSRCAAMEVPLDSRAVPGFFTHGAFNDLADRRKLGWHPEHQILLDEEDGK